MPLHVYGHVAQLLWFYTVFFPLANGLCGYYYRYIVCIAVSSLKLLHIVKSILMKISLAYIYCQDNDRGDCPAL